MLHPPASAGRPQKPSPAEKGDRLRWMRRTEKILLRALLIRRLGDRLSRWRSLWNMFVPKLDFRYPQITLAKGERNLRLQFSLVGAAIGRPLLAFSAGKALNKKTHRFITRQAYALIIFIKTSRQPLSIVGRYLFPCFHYTR